jgi:hypothetical protein
MATNHIFDAAGKKRESTGLLAGAVRNLSVAGRGTNISP